MPYTVLRLMPSVESFPSWDDIPRGSDYVYRCFDINPAFLDYLKNNNLCPEPLTCRQNAFNERFVCLSLDASTNMFLGLHFHQERDETLKKLSDKDKELHTARAAQESAEARVTELEADLAAALRSLQMLRELPEVQA